MIDLDSDWITDLDSAKYQQENPEQIQGCAMEQFFEDQKKLPPAMRSAGAYLVCNCPKCVRSRGTLCCTRAEKQWEKEI